MSVHLSARRGLSVGVSTRVTTRPMSPARDGRSRAVARLRNLLAAVGLACALATAGGCAHRAPLVQPWQREYLSRRGMRLDTPDELAEDRFRQHWYSAREGSDLGYGEPGGGCGCN